MPDTTYEYLQGVFNGEHPIQRQNPQPGESEYYYTPPTKIPISRSMNFKLQIFHPHNKTIGYRYKILFLKRLIVIQPLEWVMP